MATLLALFGPKRGLRLEIAAPLVVGRAPSSGLQLLDGTISREHCRFEAAADGALRVVDLASQNGTFVNGDRIEGARALATGDEVCIGDTLWLIDPDLDLAAAKWGDAWMLEAPSAPTEVQSPMEGAPSDASIEVVGALASAVASATGHEDRAAKILDAAIEHTGAAAAMLLAFDPARSALRPIAGRTGDDVFSVSPEVARLAAERGRAVCAAQPRGAALRSGRTLTAAGVDSLVIAPVMRGAAARGFLCVSARGRHAFSPRDVALVEAVAALADLAGLFDPIAASTSTLPAAAAGDSVDDGPVAASAAFRDVIAQARRVAQVPTTVLLLGESGTGKEEIARLLHRASPRARAPFVAVNCGAVPESIAESEWFGSERGAFTGAARSRPGWFEAADGGTLFLDEIGELGPAMQAKLLRVIEERAVCRVGSTTLRRVDVRLVAATNRDLEADVRAGRFRADLLYRLDVVRLRLPPLRGRPEDIGPLALLLARRVAARLGVGEVTLGADALRALRAHGWPGNVRELANVIERAIVLRPPSRDPITAGEIVAALPPAGSSQAASGDTLGDKVAALERGEIEAALRRARGVKSRAAEALGISRPTLDKKIADLAIDLFPEAQ